MSIFDTPQYRRIVQENALTKKFEDALFPNLMFREEAYQESWGDQTGDNKVFTGDGLLPVLTAPIPAGQDPQPSNYGREQWTAFQQPYGNSVDTHVPTAVQAAVNFLLRDVGKLGLNAGEVINRIVRDRLFNAAMSGWTVADGTQSSTTIRVKRLNGLTRARRPDLAAGSPVRYDTVTTNNPLPIMYGNTLASGPVNITGFTPDFPGDEIGPGTITVSSSISVTDRDCIASLAATARRVAGGGFRTDDIGASDKITLSDIREGLARLANMDVPKHEDGYYHMHMDPIGKGQLFADNEIQRLNISLPTGLMYGKFAIGNILGTIQFENNVCPQVHNVNIPNGSTDGAGGDNYNPAREAFAGELYPNGANAGATAKVHRALITGAEWLREYFVDQDSYMTDAGVTGKISDMPQISSAGVSVVTKGVKLIQRAPLDRFADWVSNTWKYVGDWVARPDGATGDGRYFKRGYEILFGEAL